MTDENQKLPDRKAAMSKGYTLSVATQAGQGEPWVETSVGLEDLDMAFSVLNELSAWPTCIFLYREGLGCAHWCSKNPDALNSSLHTMGITP
jgi:hypothetical protein